MSELETLFSNIISNTRKLFIKPGYSRELAQEQKKHLEDAIRNQQKLKNQEVLLMAEFYALLKQYNYVFLNSDYENLIYLKNQLQITIQPVQPIELGSPQRPPKWALMNTYEKIIPVNDVITGLSKAPKYNSKSTATKDASYYLEQVNVWIESIEQQEKIAGRETFKQLLSTLGWSFFFDQDAFIQALLVLFQASDSQKASDSKLDAYQSLLTTKLALLTTDEIKKINKVMNAATMISLGNALYAAGCIGLDALSYFALQESAHKEACSDAVKVWNVHRRQMEWQALNSHPTLINELNDLSDQAQKDFGHAALLMNQILAVTRESVETILRTRHIATPQTRKRNGKDMLVLVHDAHKQMQPVWPMYDNPLQNDQQPRHLPVKIAISATETQSIGKLLKAYLNPLPQAETQDNAFVNLMTTLNTLFFNPNQFIDQVANLKPEKIQWLVTQGTDKEVKKLYKSLQTAEVNQLILLLNHIKKGDAVFMQSFCQHLGLPQLTAESTSKWESLQMMTSELCQSIDLLASTVKAKLEKTTLTPLKKYPYKIALEQNNEPDSSWKTVKNSACMKQYLQRYIKGYDKLIQRSFLEKCYDWIYPVDKNVKPEPLSLASPVFLHESKERYSSLNLDDTTTDSIVDLTQLYALTPGLTPVPE